MARKCRGICAVPKIPCAPPIETAYSDLRYRSGDLVNYTYQQDVSYPSVCAFDGHNILTIADVCRQRSELTPAFASTFALAFALAFAPLKDEGGDATPGPASPRI